ncbi:MAG: calcium-binding protein [Pseudomonadota bacterium]
MNKRIDTSAGAQRIAQDETLIIGRLGSVSGEIAVDFVSGLGAGQVYVGGFVIGSHAGAELDGNDDLVIRESGAVMAAGVLGSDAVRLSGVGNNIVVQGSIFGTDTGITSEAGSTMRVLIARNGGVQGGSNNTGNDHDMHSAAIAASSGAVVTNLGAIIGDLNPDTGKRVAVLNARATTQEDEGYDAELYAELTLVNRGLVRGDVIMGGGIDRYDGRGDGWVVGTIDLGNGNDIAFGGNDVDFILGGAGSDSIRGGDGRDTIHGGDNGDYIIGGLDNDYLWGDGGNDLLVGARGNDTLRGGEGDDFLKGNHGDDSLFGGGNHDRIDGGSGDDFLSGSRGRDTLEGRDGNDTLSGGEQADVFLFRFGTGDDIIVDFSISDGDAINLRHAPSIHSFTDLVANHVVDTPDGALITTSFGDTILVQGVAVADLDEASFIF